ncbi:MAG: hypothetical protein A2Y33_05875 [Spirochaetes bacterium GWF1_51_8]|nr:MAG: hypothetical protein A2Y33_05875 [Spirochaetes bacterium GWF1_51_8]
MDSTVSIVRCGEYDRKPVYDKIGEAIALAGGLSEFKGKKVLLKPNILFPVGPERPLTTNPVFAGEAARHFLEAGAYVYVGDSPGVHPSHTAGRASGIMQAVLDAGAHWVDFHKGVELPNPDGRMVKRFLIADIIQAVDAVVSLPKLKTHGMMYYTGGMKNLYGMIPGLNKAQLHVRFPERENFAAMIVDLNLLLKPAMCIMDGVVAMEGPGPSNGYPRNTGVILASKNILALDITACRIINYKPEHIPILADALTRKYWLTSPDEITVKGETVESVFVKDFKHVKIVHDAGFIKKSLPWLFNFINKLIVPKPRFLHDKCIRCGECIKICKSNALVFKHDPKSSRGKKVEVDYRKCIRCYCCHEICPADAIRLK